MFVVINAQPLVRPTLLVYTADVLNHQIIVYYYYYYYVLTEITEAPYPCGNIQLECELRYNSGHRCSLDAVFTGAYQNYL